MHRKNDKIAALLHRKRSEQRKSFAVLLDPDKIDFSTFPDFLRQAAAHHVDFFFVGGSLVTRYALDQLVEAIHVHTTIPAILFPGNSLHIEPSADAILLLSLISGRNPELLIGQHVIAAPVLRQSNLEILPTGYMLVESGKLTTVSYMSNTIPMPHDKPSVAACTMSKPNPMIRARKNGMLITARRRCTTCSIRPINPRRLSASGPPSS